jgi:nucleoid-associated protein YgaU
VTAWSEPALGSGPAPARCGPVRTATAVLGPAGALTGLTLLLRWACQGTEAAVAAPGSASLPDLLVLSAAAAAWCVAAGVSAGVVVAVLAVVRPRAVPHRVRALLPVGTRRVAAALLGAGIVATAAATAGTAHADSGLGGWSADRPAAPSAPGPDHGLTEGHRGTDRRSIVVRRGDTLWAIAARGLPASSSAGDIAASWPRWYAANRDVVGPDPDLIRPGQVLHPPERPQ